MDENSTERPAEAALLAGEAWFDPIEAGLRERIRGFIEELLEQELTAALGRRRHGRGPSPGHRHGHRERRLTGSFGPVAIAVPRARLRAEDGSTREWRSAALPRYARRTRQVEALIAGAYLSGTDTRRVQRALAALFRGAVGKDVVSRTWRKLKTDWEAWCRRDLAGEDVVRLILDGTVVRVRVDRKAASVSLLVVLGVRRDGQKVLLAVKGMGGEGEAAWRAVLDDLTARPAGARVSDRRRRGRARAGAGRAVARGAGPAVHGPQAPQPARPRAGAAARGGLGRLHRHDLRRDAEGDRAAPPRLPARVAAEVPRGGRQPGGGGRAALHLHAAVAEPVEVGPDHERDRAVARGVQAADQDADGPALGRDRGHAVLGAARLGPDHHAQGRRLADPGRAARRRAR